MVALIQEHGRKFKTISKIINRTPLNIKDKLKSMGDENYLLRNSDWMIHEVVHFLRLLAKYVIIFIFLTLIVKMWFHKRGLGWHSNSNIWRKLAFTIFENSDMYTINHIIERKKFKQYKVLLDEDSIRKVLLIVNYETF